MRAVYIEFKTPGTEAKLQTEGYFRRSLKKIGEKIFNKIFPLANPDVEDKIDRVTLWYVECDGKTGVPQREIGLREDELVLKLPDERNMGFWTDSNMLLDDFMEHFDASEISKEFFEDTWTRFDKISNFEIELDNFIIVSVVGGKYITSYIDYKGVKRKLAVFFMHKSDEAKIAALSTVKVAGLLNDNGPSESLHLNRAWIVDTP